MSTKKTVAGIVLLFTLYMSVAYLSVVSAGPAAVGLWSDDAIYLITAKSLANGNGYRHSEIPGQPFQTKYPILYPAFLALGFLIKGNYPQNLLLLLVPGAAAAAGFVVLSALFSRKVLGASRRTALVICLLSALSPEIVSLVRFTMSDLPYAFFAIAAILCLDLKYFSSKSGRQWIWLAASAFLISAAILTRNFGLPLGMAAVLMLVLRRRFAATLALVGIVSVCVLPWYLWQHWAFAHTQSPPLDAYYLDYSLWLPRNFDDLARGITQNVFRTAFAIGNYQLAFPITWSGEDLSKVSVLLVATHFLCYLAVALILAGFLVSVRRGLKTIHVYAVLYVLMMLAWPADPSRFLISWTPFILFFLVSGVHALRSAVGHRLPDFRGTNSTELLSGTVLAVAILVLGFSVIQDRKIVSSKPDNYYFFTQSHDLTEMIPLSQWIAENTSPKDVLAANDSLVLYLNTGRQGHDYAPWTDPYAFSYSAERKWWQFYLKGTDSESQWLGGWVRSDLVPTYKNAGIRYYIHNRNQEMASFIERFLTMNPQRFQPCFATEHTYIVYRLTL